MDLVINREAMLRSMFAAMDLNSDGKVSKDEVAKLCQANMVDPESEAVKAAFQTADFSGQGGGGDGSLSIDEIIVWNLERTAGLDDAQFEQYIRGAMDFLQQFRAESGNC